MNTTAATGHGPTWPNRAATRTGASRAPECQTKSVNVPTSACSRVRRILIAFIRAPAANRRSVSAAIEGDPLAAGPPRRPDSGDEHDQPGGLERDQRERVARPRVDAERRRGRGGEREPLEHGAQVERQQR